MKDCNLQSFMDLYFFVFLDIDKRDSYGKIVFYCVVLVGQVNIVKYFFYNYVNFNFKDYREEVLLYVVVWIGNIEVVEVEFKEFKLYF